MRELKKFIIIIISSSTIIKIQYQKILIYVCTVPCSFLAFLRLLLSGTIKLLIRHKINVNTTHINLLFSLEVRKSESFKVTKNAGMSFNIGVNILGFSF